MIVVEIAGLDDDVVKELYHFNATIRTGFRKVLCETIKTAVDNTIPNQDCTVRIGESINQTIKASGNNTITGVKIENLR